MDNKQLLLECLKSSVTLIAVALAAWFAYRKYLKENNDKKELIANAVFGELKNIVEHFTYAKDEIDLVLSSEKERKIRLKYSKFGPLKSIEKIDQLGNLSSDQIRLVLQLNLRIRNTDLLLDFLSEIDKLTESEIVQLESRMSYCIYSANKIIESILLDRKNEKQVTKHAK